MLLVCQIYFIPPHFMCKILGVLQAMDFHMSTVQVLIKIILQDEFQCNV